jgi:hypothetical protein
LSTKLTIAIHAMDPLVFNALVTKNLTAGYKKDPAV